MIPLDPETATHLSAALATGPGALLDVLNGLLLDLPGVRTVTWLAALPEQKITRRIYVDKLPIVGNSPAEMAVYIPETADLEAMGYGATLCMPIVIGGTTRGTVNLLGEAGIFTPDVLGAVNALLPLAALIFTYPGIGTR
jgi:hypothetical protein